MSDYKETKEALDFGLTMAMTADDKLQDGFQWTDLFAFVQPMTKLPAAIEGIENVPTEIANLKNDEEGRLELVEYVKDLFNIADDKAEALVEQGIRAGLELGVLVTMLRDSKK